MPKKEFKTIKLDAVAFEKLTYLCEAMRQKKSVFLSELLKEIFEIGGMFKSLNISYESYGDKLTIEFSGRSRIVSGSFPSGNRDVGVDKKIEKESKMALKKANEK